FLSAFFMAASKLLRALSQALSLRGTAHPPMPLHLFSLGFSPQPPKPAQSFSPLQLCDLAVAHCPMPAQSFFLPLLTPLQVFRPRHTWGSCSSRGLSGSFILGLSSSLAAATATPAPAISPPIAAAVSLWNSRRFTRQLLMKGV